MARKKAKKRNADDSLFDDQEIASYTDQSDAPFKQPQPKAPPSPSPSEIADSFSLRQTVIDDSALKDMAVPGDGTKERFAMDRRKRWVVILAVLLIVVYVLVILFPQDLFSVFTAGDGAAARFSLLFQANIDILTRTLSGRSAIGLAGSSILIFALVALVGAGLSTVGAAYQGSFRNALATPSTLGVMSGASCGLVIYIMTRSDAVMAEKELIITSAEQAAQFEGEAITDFTYYLSQMQGALYCLAGAAIVVLLTVLISSLAGRGHMSMVTLIVAGQVFSSLANALVVLFRLYLETSGGQEAVESLAMIQTGDFSTIGSPYDLLFLGLPILVCIVLLILFSGRMNALTFGDDEGRLLGVHVGLLRGLVVALCTIITALIVSFVGSIGFVGFLVPHMMRRLVGPDFRYLMPASALAGGIFMLLVYYIFSALPLVEGGIGVVTTCIGAIVFLFAIVQQRKVPNARE